MNQARAQTRQKECHNSIRGFAAFLNRRVKPLLLLAVTLMGAGSATGPVSAMALPIPGASHQIPDTTGQIRALKPTSLAMIDQAIAVLESGLQGMNDLEREVLLQIYDPAGTGDIDEEYLRTMLKNYRAIRAALESDFNVRQVNHRLCVGQRIYLTNLRELIVCPYFQVEENEYRKARTLIHEVSHMALVVSDRPYFRPTSKQYETLTPRGSWLSQLPLAGPIIREILKGDTLYHPDAYAHFAMAVSGLPGSENYPDHGPTAPMMESTTAAEIQAIDSWAVNQELLTTSELTVPH